MAIAEKNASEASQNAIIPILLFLIRLQIGSIQNYRYHISQYLFPILVRGHAYGILNGVARPFSALAAIVTEYASEPAIFMLLASVLILVAASFLIPTKED